MVQQSMLTAELFPKTFLIICSGLKTIGQQFLSLVNLSRFELKDRLGNRMNLSSPNQD